MTKCGCDTCTGKRCNHCGCKTRDLEPGSHKSGSMTTVVGFGQRACASICCKCGEQTGIFWPVANANAAAAAPVSTSFYASVP